MTTQGIFSETISMLSKALDLRSRKHSVIVSNIANIDTPNYKAFDLMVEAEMNKSQGTRKKLSIDKTHSGHLSPDGSGSDPGGTTLAGLAVMEEANFREILKDTIAAATTRSRELSGD